MDTNFWGPPAWKLLHLITYTYPQDPNKNHKRVYAKFFNTLKTVLPCSYCQKSITQFYNQLPIENSLDNKEKLVKWLYDIHNLVNNKLRQQGLLKNNNPSLEDVNKQYNQYLKQKCQIIGWNFLYSVVLNYPEDAKEITKKIRGEYDHFFTYLSRIIPCSKYKTTYKIYTNSNPLSNALKNRETLLTWLFLLNASMNEKMSSSDTTYEKLKSNLQKFKVQKCDNNTCRL